MAKDKVAKLEAKLAKRMAKANKTREQLERAQREELAANANSSIGDATPS